MTNKFIFSLVLFAVSAVINTRLFAQVQTDDTLKIAVKQAEDLFLKNNPQLPAEHNSIDMGGAQVITARLFNNPDFNYNKLSSYGQNFISAGVSLPLPFFNRNQGAVKQAAITVDQSKVQLQNQHDQVESNIAVNYKIAAAQKKVHQSFDPGFKQEFNHLIEKVYKNYLKRNISLLEFLDYYDTYKTNTLLMNNLLLNRITALERVNYVTGTPFFNQ